jgi:hypothetical protein
VTAGRDLVSGKSTIGASLDICADARCFCLFPDQPLAPFRRLATLFPYGPILDFHWTNFEMA